MFQSRTLFVVGAGASCEADFPDGRALKDKIASLLNITFDFSDQTSGDRRIVEALRTVVRTPDGRHGDINPLRVKCQQIRSRMPMALSIDNYINAHADDPEIEICGKLAIVKGILDAEASSKLKHKNEHTEPFLMSSLLDTWYAKLFTMLYENVGKADVGSIFNNISIITFNYDRSIERFFAQAIEEYYELPRSRAEEIVRNLRIYHPYGKVGDLPWESAGAPVRYGERERANLLEISKKIKTFTEGMDDTAKTAEMQELVAQAQHVVFLGFAFHPQNLELIQAPPGKTSARRVFATAMGMSPSDQGAVKASVAAMLNRQVTAHQDAFVQADKLSFDFLNGTCAGLFGDYRRSLAAPVA